MASSLEAPAPSGLIGSSSARRAAGAALATFLSSHGSASRSKSAVVGTSSKQRPPVTCAEVQTFWYSPYFQRPIAVSSTVRPMYVLL